MIIHSRRNAALGAVAGCCHGREALSRALAEQLADKACVHLGEDVAVYECPDKGNWHVGSKEQASRVVRAFPFTRWCKECGNLIPDERLLASLRSDYVERYCSILCRQ